MPGRMVSCVSEDMDARTRRSNRTCPRALTCQTRTEPVIEHSHIQSLTLTLIHKRRTMRLLLPKYIVLLCLSAAATTTCSASAEGAGEAGDVNPPNLQPLINQGNALLGAGQFGEAIRAFSEAIGLPPFLPIGPS